MPKTSVTGYPRIGKQRELKFWTEDYFKGRISAENLQENAASLRHGQWLTQQKAGIDFIPSNDFSFYDGMLDTVFMLNAVPREYGRLGLSPLDTYFAMARGYQGGKGDAKAMPMKKWFNTNYHYIVPQLDDAMEIKLNDAKPFDEYKEALNAGVKTKPVIMGPFTFLKLAEYRGKKNAADFAPAVTAVYTEILSRFSDIGAGWVQIDEPSLVTDLNEEDVKLFKRIYGPLLKNKGNVKILLQTYFGDIRDIYSDVIGMGFDGIGLDFVEGKKTAGLIAENGFPKDTLLFAGLVNGKNIWRNHYGKTMGILDGVLKTVKKENIVVNTSCSLLLVPYTLESETEIDGKIKVNLAFAEEKLSEIKEISELLDDAYYKENPKYTYNLSLINSKKEYRDKEIQKKIDALTEKDFTRLPEFAEREKIQKKILGLPALPTTTIGSFPQTKEVKSLRAKFRKKEITKEEYDSQIKGKISECIKLQEKIGLDVLVHGEFERNDMVEYFGENLSGFLFTKKAWVQSYGTRCVKPPIIWSDVKRTKPITVETSKFAQSLTKKPVKGMLTGPVTILNWSFPREDVSRKEMAFQIALAIKAEVQDLEAAGLKIIQIDEAALREKLPLRRADWHTDYLDWAIPAFRLVHSSVKPETQIHTHMCYSEFGDIVEDIDAMDADVISFEASRSNLEIIGDLDRVHFKTEVGPGVYDIHSPRIPGETEITDKIKAMLEKIPKEKLWINPDCGLKTRGEAETTPSLCNMVAAAKACRG